MIIIFFWRGWAVGLRGDLEGTTLLREAGVNFGGASKISYQKVGKNIGGGLRGALVIIGGATAIKPYLEIYPYF